MMCDLCGARNAVIVVQQVSNKGKQELHLCLKCAKEQGIFTGGGKLELSLSGLFESLQSAKQPDRLCPVCGRGLADIKKTNRVGCPECYGIFSAEIKDILKKQDITGPYTGSMPERLANFRSVLTDRMMLRTKLEESIASENYEKAALYRDRLKALERCPVTDGENSEEQHS